ncbi:glutaredoxin family protein [Caldimonas aquatica]|uniref:Glutaredoxin family protein n=1 Tax=Caldimonas aquatica TaxID=376175 RepID=A0ABY6MV73_9BURK|nr:glutaredoxin family protein [Schlegelella aquatica]UZD55912.1 glutaredoxin family protein [Schlegelella aquatica]
MPRLREVVSLALIAAVVLGGASVASHYHEQRLAQRMAAAQPGDIVMFSTTECPYCAKARVWLDEHRVNFTECNLSVSQACRQAFERLGGRGVPTFVVQGQVRSGFDPAWIAGALGR